MAPLSKSEMVCEREKTVKYDAVISEISEKLSKIDIDKIKTEYEQSTYDIDDETDDDDESTATNTNKNLDECATIKEKGADRRKTNDNRTNPYPVLNTSGVSYNYNNDMPQNVFNLDSGETSGLNNAEQYTFTFNNFPIESFNQFYGSLTENNNFLDDAVYSFDNTSVYNSPIVSDNSSDYSYVPPLLANIENVIPATIEQNIAQTSNSAEKALSDYIDKNKKLKQPIWIQVNIEIEEKLIEKLRIRIVSARFNQIDLIYIYAIIIRLMKDAEGKKLLQNYFLSDENILFDVAIKGNVLLMNFILEVHQNLGINPNRFNILFQIVDNTHIDLYEILETLLNKMFDDKPWLKMFDVNCVDAAKQTILMIVLKNIAMNKGSLDVNTRYFNLILSLNPDYVTNDGKSILDFAMDWRCGNDIVERIKLHYSAAFNNNLIDQEYQTEWNPACYYTNY